MQQASKQVANFNAAKLYKKIQVFVRTHIDVCTGEKKYYLQDFSQSSFLATLQSWNYDPHASQTSGYCGSS